MAGLHVQLDVEYANDPKMIEAGALAELLYVRALCFAKRTMKDGLITRSQLPAVALGIPSPLRHVAKLVEVGAWEEAPGGWQIVAWLKRNKSADRITADTAAKKLKSAMGNHERWHVQMERYDPTCDLCNPYGDPRLDPTGIPTARIGESTEEETETETQPEEETQVEPESSSSSEGPHLTIARDDETTTIELIVDARCQGRTFKPGGERGYRHVVRQEARDLDGPVIRQQLALGLTPQQAAMFVLGYGTATAQEQAASRVPWCGPDCPTCDGVAFIDTGNGLAPCPERRVA